MAKEKLLSFQQTEQSKFSTSFLPENLKNILRNPLTKSESVCSCGKGVMNERLDSVFGDEYNEASSDLKMGDESPGYKGLPDKDSKEKLDEPDTHGDAMEGYDGTGNRSDDNVFIDDKDPIGETDDNDKGARVKISPRLDIKGQKHLSVSFSFPESEFVLPTAMERISPALETLVALENSGPSKTDESKCTNKSGLEQIDCVAKECDQPPGNTPNESSSNGDKETRIGNIVYLPVEEDVNGQVTVRSVEITANHLSHLSESDFAQISKSDSDLVDSSLNVTNKEVEKTRSSSTSSLGPFSPTPHLSAFVNYATGFFQRHASDSSIKDIKDVIIDSLSEIRLPESVVESKESEDSKTETKFDIPTVSAALPGRRRGKMSRHEHQTSAGGVAVESAVTMEDKPNLLTMDYDRK